MTTSLTDSKEYKCYEKFIASPEFIQLTQGEGAVFPDFDAKNVADLNKMRDYLFESIPAVQRKAPLENLTSVRLSQMQIGQAFIAREEYRQYEKQHPVNVGKGNTTATVNPHRRLGRLKGNRLRA